MRIASIELVGCSNTTLRDGTPGLPRAFARIHRVPGGEFIEVTILAPSGEHIHKVPADNPADLWPMAERLQETLDGSKGTHGDIDEYFRVIQMLGD